MTSECAGSMLSTVLNELCLHYSYSGATYLLSKNRIRANKRKAMDIAYLFQYNRLVVPCLPYTKR